MKLEGLGTVVSLVSLAVTIWKFSSSYADMRHRLELKDQQIEAFLDQQELILNGLKENFKHFSDRFRGEVGAVSDRVTQIEDYLTKTSDFQRRK
jgi:hypothetical protein